MSKKRYLYQWLFGVILIWSSLSFASTQASGLNMNPFSATGTTSRVDLKPLSKSKILTLNVPGALFLLFIEAIMMGTKFLAMPDTFTSTEDIGLTRKIRNAEQSVQEDAFSSFVPRDLLRKETAYKGLRGCLYRTICMNPKLASRYLVYVRAVNDLVLLLGRIFPSRTLPDLSALEQAVKDGEKRPQECHDIYQCDAERDREAILDDG